jgi:hypothetical protein
MKIDYQKKILVLLLASGLFFALHFAHAQATADTGSAVTTDPNTDVSDLSDLEVELKALEMATPIAASNEPSVGNFYSAQHAPGSAEEWPPMPGNIFGLPVWPLDTNIFVIDDLGFRYNESSAKTTKTANGIEAEDDFVVPSPPGGGSDTNTYNPPILTDLMPDYGTNLFIVSLGMVSGNLTGIASNTLADVEYAIQTNGDLTQTTNWADDGQFILGSEATNWTQFILPPPLSTNNLFFRLQSWASSDGSGLPTWWELKYFGQDTNIDPYADPTGDGYTLLQDFQNGWNPNVYITPPPPQGVTVVYNTSTGMANVSWLPSSGNVTGYTIRDSDGNTFNVSVGATTFTEAVTDHPDPDYGGDIMTTYTVQADYSDGNSTISGAVPLESTPISASIIPGPNGTAYLAISAFPPNTANIRLTDIDDYAVQYLGENGLVTNYDIPIGDFTNGLYPLPNNLVPSDGNYRGVETYNWYAQAEGTNGNGLTATTWLLQDYNSPQDGFFNSWLVPPFFDGRVQLKQNLIFQVRAAIADQTFQYTEIGGQYVTITSPTNYAYAGYYFFWPVSPELGFTPYLDSFLPFEENYFDRNFVYDSSYLDANGLTTTGVGGNFYDSSYLTITSPETFADYLELPVAFEFAAPTNNDVPIASVLATNQTQWLATYALGSAQSYLGLIGVSPSQDESGNNTFTMTNDVPNYFGLSFLSAKIAWGNGEGESTTLSAGNTVEDNSAGYFYPQTAQPKFQTVGYDFWVAPNSFSQFYTNGMDYPGMNGPVNTHTNPVFITGVGQGGFQVAGYAKLAVTNSAYSGVYGYLGQYFTNAFEIDTNGNVTTNLTGVLSPYGNFFPTQPGPVALVTMPDPDTGEQGTGVVNCISLNVDKNHDTVMDLSWDGPDVTSQASPMEFWVNSGYSGVEGDAPVMNDVLSDYTFGNITSERDLENFARLWICGMPALTNGYQVRLSWANVSSGNPGINLYTSVETNGGTGYLTDTNIALEQSEFSFSGSSPYSVVKTGIGVAIAEITNGVTYTFPASYFTNSGNKYFLFEGAGIGAGELQLSVTDAYGNMIAQTGVWLDLHDIEDFYEFARATNVTSSVPPSSLISQLQVLRTVAAAPDATKQMVIFVHGINNTEFSAQDSTEIIFKRLYWSGYYGRVAEFRWPCGYLPTENTWYPFEYNKSEFWAYKSASAFKDYLTYLRNRADLSGYTLNILAHSQGNAVASEALSEGAPFDNYVLSQGAVPAMCYDGSAPTLQTLLNAEAVTPTPFAASVGGYNECWTNISGNLIDFYNTNDFALASGVIGGIQANWVADQASQKPEAFIGGPSYIFYPSNQTSVAYYTLGSHYTVTDWQESRAMVARSHTSAVGAQGGLAGVIKGSVDLKASFGFGSTRPEHSAQFSRPIQTSLDYYQKLLTEIQPTP